jgi:hypothetical protein
MISRASSRTRRSNRRSNLSVLAGVISDREKRLYRCEDSPEDGDQVACEPKFQVTEELFKQTQRCGNLLHGVRSF